VSEGSSIAQHCKATSAAQTCRRKKKEFSSFMARALVARLNYTQGKKKERKEKSDSAH